MIIQNAQIPNNYKSNVMYTTNFTISILQLFIYLVTKTHQSYLLLYLMDA